ncbi:MAG: response regulator transcription factor [Limnochordia bacterium]|jgi:NarL family two-component system response regulator LiaR|nr:response regulator transcription factor [Bacillota bacterium]HOB09595.1 response regulator transcription factor [Limnochordia bacterium]NLH30619.1 response regulator transcription factor [Bacillota bacterium]HPT93298.1 response regulator transcription factor [Limnochordia bacterium]HPZ31534.1 response regulator transcription factor [Limnochordia bacterium]
MAENRIKVLIVDDHEMVRLGLSAYLQTEPDITVIGEAENGLAALEFCRATAPDVVLMDLVMEPLDGIEATKRILAIRPEAKIIVLTSFIDETKILPALEAGATSYLLKTAKADEIVRAIRGAVKNESVIEPAVAAKMLKSMLRQEPRLHDSLTERELEVLKLIGQGKSNQEIADELFIGIKTVKTHVSNILSKLQCEDRTQAAIYANRHGLV